MTPTSARAGQQHNLEHDARVVGRSARQVVAELLIQRPQVEFFIDKLAQRELEGALFIQGAKAALMSAHKRDDAISRWALQLRQRLGWQKACVALANKNARILWAVMTRDKPFDAGHVSLKPQAKCKAPAAPPGAAPCGAMLAAT